MKIIKKDVEMLSEAYSDICNKSNRRGKREVVEEFVPAVAAMAPLAARVATSLGTRALVGAGANAVKGMFNKEDAPEAPEAPEDAEDFGDEEGDDYRDPFTKLRDDIQDYIDDLSRGMYDEGEPDAHTIAVELQDILQRNKAEEAKEY